TAGSGLPTDYTFVATDNGSHTFTNGVTLKTAGGQTVTVTYTGNAAVTATTGTITVSAAAANKVIFGQQPTNATAGVAISPAVTVKVEDQFNNVVTSDSSTVTLTLSTGTFEGGSSTASVAASSGVATFSALKIDVAGSYTLSATVGSLTGS